MTATSAQLGYGTQIQRGNGATPETFTTIAELLDIDGPSLEAESVDATHQGSPSGFKESIQGLADGGEVSADIQYVEDDTTQSNVRADLLARRGNSNWKIIFPGGETWAFVAHITKFELKAPVEDKMTAGITWKISGKPTIS